MNIQHAAFFGSFTNRGRDIQFFAGPGSGKLSEFTQRHFYIAGPQFNIAGEIFEFPFIPDFDRRKTPVSILTYAHAFRIIAVGTEWRRAAGTDPFISALMSLLLLFQPFAQGIH